MTRYVADQNLPYFCTVTVLEWLPILIEERYINPIIDSLTYCRTHKNLQLFAYVIMPNHIHLICGCDAAPVPPARADAEDRRGSQEASRCGEGARRDSRTSGSRTSGRGDSRASGGSRTSGYPVGPDSNGADNALHPIMRDFKRFTSRAIHDRLKEDGRTTLLRWLREATEPSRRARGELGLWRPGFHPQSIRTRRVYEQKVAYLHANPVRKGLVVSPDDWRYSSAGYYMGRTDVRMEPDALVL